MRLLQLLMIICTILAFATSGCGSKHEARTPGEFVEMYSKAWQNEDAEAILELRVRRDFAGLNVDPALRKALEDSSKADERGAIERSIKRHDFEYLAWTRTTFEGARDHGDHVHVDVRIDAARSEVVLVRKEGLLRIHPNPSLFQ